MEKQFSKYLNGTVNPEEYKRVIEAISAQDNNDKLSADLLIYWKKTLGDVVENRVNSQLLDKIHHRIALEESKSVARRLRLYRNLLKVAAVLITGLLVTTTFLSLQPEKQHHTSVIETVTAPHGARSSFRLPDGSEVWLNSGSTISFSRQYDGNRTVELSGQAYFQVVKENRPFLVKTSYGNIEVMGTSFDVKAYPEDNFVTTVVEGTVKVRNKKNQVAILKPGQQSMITQADAFSMKEVNTELSTSWKEGKLIFVKEPFANVARELERWYNVKIELKAEKLKKLGYTGTIEMETFSEVLELINTTTPIKYNFDKNTRILKISGR